MKSLIFNVIAAMTVSGPIGPDGRTEVTCDLPPDQRQHNTGGRDGAGLCVFTSIEHAARWQNERGLEQFQSFMRKELGGGYPDKVDKMIAKYAPGTKYIQYQGKDPAILKAALASGRMPCVTYNGHDPHYSGGISHMVNLIYLDDKYACILDNNFVKENQLVWMTPTEFYKRWGNDGGWAVVLLSPPPPPPPRNLNAKLNAKTGDTDCFRRRRRPALQPQQPDPEPTLEITTIKGTQVDNINARVTNFGLQDDKICQTAKEVYTLNGKDSSKEDALKELGRALHLTIIGSDDERQEVLATLTPEDKANLIIQDYPRDHWAVQAGFVTTGHPTIYLQTSDGKVLHRQDEFDDDGAGLHKAIRRTDPRYDKKKDPDQRNTISLSNIPTWAYVAAAIGAFLILRRKKQ